MYERGFEFVIGKVINSHIFLNVKHVHSFFFFLRRTCTQFQIYIPCVKIIDIMRTEYTTTNHYNHNHEGINVVSISIKNPVKLDLLFRMIRNHISNIFYCLP